jgi:hypothetical protein
MIYSTLVSPASLATRDCVVNRRQSPTAYMTNTRESDPVQVPLRFDDPRGGSRTWGGYEIWSCRFSADWKEAIAGGSGMIYGE